MLEFSDYNLLNELKKPFNLVLDSGYYPESWNHGMIYTIYKSGPKHDPSNYRGITLTSCLRKTFSTLLHVRIENEVEKKKILSQSPAGFRKNYRTTDHIMTLITLIPKKSPREEKYLYTCFVDFRKAYDLIFREGLIYRLKEFGPTGHILEIIKTMCATQRVFLLCEREIGQSFTTKIGVKQGDVLSALLFNLYMNDLLDLLDNVTINNLLSADDLTILSWSRYDHQKKISNWEYTVKNEDQNSISILR